METNIGARGLLKLLADEYVQHGRNGPSARSTPVDFINRAQKEGMPRGEAIQASGMVRFRPVLLTTVTTVGGLIPLAFFASGQAKFLSPMAISVVWGLSFATILTLILLPCLYAMLDDLAALLRRLVGIQAPTEVSPSAKTPDSTHLRS